MPLAAAAPRLALQVVGLTLFVVTALFALASMANVDTLFMVPYVAFGVLVFGSPVVLALVCGSMLRLAGRDGQ